MTRRLAIIIILLTTLTGSLRAQWDVQFSDFTALKSYYNPGISGTDGLLNVSGAVSMQMMGYEKAPMSIFVSADLPIYFLSPRHGFGIQFMSDQEGIFNSMKTAAQYAFNVKLTRNTRLALGVQGALLMHTVDPGKIELEETGDKAFPQSSTKGNQFDLGIGFFLYNPKYWVGFSGAHLLAPTIGIGEFNEISLSRMYYLMGGCKFEVMKKLLTLEPAALVQSDIHSWRADIQCKANININEKNLYAGIGYSPLVSTTFMVGGLFHGICFGYSYQLYTQGSGVGNGTHEIVVGYRNNLDLFKKGRNKHKSVRWL